MIKIGVINVGGNINNILNLLAEFDFVKLELVNDKISLQKKDLIIFPGVNDFGETMKTLKKKGLLNSLANHLKKKPYIGICIGMHILFSESEEKKNIKGLNIFQSKIKQINYEKNKKRFEKKLNVGWRNIDFLKCKIFKNFLKNKKSENFYFMHKYYLPARKNYIYDEQSFIKFGNNLICAHFIKDNIFATQFHLERSGEIGKEILKKIILYFNKRFS